MNEIDARIEIATILRLLRERRLPESQARARLLLASCMPTERAVAEACLTIVQWRAGIGSGRPLDEGLPEVIAGVDCLQREDCQQSLGWVCSAVGYALGLLGDFESGHEWLERSIEDALRRADRPQLLAAYSHKASLLAYAEEHGRAIALFEQALELCDGERGTIRGGLLNNLAYCRILLARRCETTDPVRTDLARVALRYADQALADRESPDYPRWSGSALDNRGIALGMLGAFAEAESTFAEGLRHPDVSPRVRVDLLVDCAEVYIAQGKLAAATGLLAQADEEATQDLVDQTRDRILELRIEIARRADRHEDTQLLWERRFRAVAERYRERLRNVRRYTELNLELRQARAAIRESRLQERESLLQDLHDGFGSQLAGARLRSEFGELSQAEMTNLLQECINDLYLVVDTFNGDEGSLAEALRFMRHRYESRMIGQEIQVQWSITLDGAPPIPAHTTIQILRVVQEAVSNALKHAGARNIRVAAVHDSAATVVVRIDDDGRGMPEQCEERTGLRGMRNRAQVIGAELSILALAPGTRIEIRIPASAPDTRG